MALRLEINALHPQPRLLDQVVEVLRSGGLVIYPTDTVYALGCDIQNKRAVERVCRIKGVDPEKANFSCICADVSILSDYAVGITTPLYKLLKSALPGPYTFVVKASKTIPRHFQSTKKTVGIRVSGHPIPTELARRLGNPILTTSLNDPTDEMVGYLTDPVEMFSLYQKQIDCLVDGGFGGLVPSTVIDISGDRVMVLREGLGALEPLNLVLEE
jgi:tRNA threonylcarbamoyl adenosine modification protein (Sua5/YciO/YrdC/YwlC family)